VLSLTYHLAAAGGPHRIRANGILPGLIRTPSTEMLFAKVAVFLASDDAWYINAAAIPVDGGQSVIE
jgi:NAD(P)-dependent dehydrogenase (short-subunit alcohol dehydrogenase family)